MYVYYHRAEDLSAALVEAGFVQIEILRQGYTKADGTHSTHVILLAGR